MPRIRITDLPTDNLSPTGPNGPRTEEMGDRDQAELAAAEQRKATYAAIEARVGDPARDPNIPFDNRKDTPGKERGFAVIRARMRRRLEKNNGNGYDDTDVIGTGARFLEETQDPPISSAEADSLMETSLRSRAAQATLVRIAEGSKARARQRARKLAELQGKPAASISTSPKGPKGILRTRRFNGHSFR